ncbi:hypothetical protein DFH09DRAFT_1359379 [Mycena vulgaris]|nr:hypothetical protein DFH09DRAFT_1359379 [Mycena vulgaris]
MRGLFAAVFAPASVPPTTTTTQPPPASVATVTITSTLAPVSAPPAPTTKTSTPTPTPPLPTGKWFSVYATVTQVLTTTPTLTTGPSLNAPHETTSGTLASIIPVWTTNAGYSLSRSSSFSRSSAARASASALEPPSPSPHKPKSNTGKYVGYAIGAVFFLTLISSFFSAYRKHRKFMRKRPRGSIFIGAGLSAGQRSPQERSMAQALMRSVSNSSFDAYALSDTPPTSPAPVFRPRGFSPSPIPIRPLPPTPSPKYTIHEDDALFYAPNERSQYSPFGASSSGSSTQTSRDAR